MSRVVGRQTSASRIGAWSLVLLAAGCAPADDEAPRADTATASACARDSLRVTLDSIGAASGGRMSVSVHDPATGERFGVNGAAPVFMSSVVKLPLAVQLLARVDAGELRLADTIAVTPEQLSLGRSPLSERYPAGFSMRVDSLLRYAISESDNTANDALLRHSGGPRRATAELQRLGIADIRIDRSYLGYGWDLFGGAELPANATITRPQVDSLRTLALAASGAVHDSLSAAFASQPEDRASTDAVAALLARLARGELLSDSSRALLLRLMTQTNNPAARIVAALPEGATAAHKTGTWTDWNDVFTSISDVGIVTLPDGRRVALAIMVAEARAEEAALDSAIAAATRAVLADWERCP